METERLENELKQIARGLENVLDPAMEATLPGHFQEIRKLHDQILAVWARMCGYETVEAVPD